MQYTLSQRARRALSTPLLRSVPHNTLYADCTADGAKESLCDAARLVMYCASRGPIKRRRRDGVRRLELPHMCNALVQDAEKESQRQQEDRASTNNLCETLRPALSLGSRFADCQPYSPLHHPDQWYIVSSRGGRISHAFERLDKATLISRTHATPEDWRRLSYMPVGPSAMS